MDPGNLSGSLKSFWQTDISGLRFPALQKNRSAEVVIIGAGITGLTAAYFLTKSGKKVIVMERGDLGGHDTSRTTAHLTVLADPGYHEIKKINGKNTSKFVYQTHANAIDVIESLAASEKIDCDFKRVPGYLYLCDGDKPKTLEQELKALKMAGCKNAVWLERNPFPSEKENPAVYLPNQGRFHPLKYLRGLAQAINAGGGEIYTGTAVQKIEHGAVVTSQGYKITASHIVSATHSPIDGTFVFLKQEAYRSYVAAARIPKDSLEDALYWDTGEPYHYARLEPLNAAEDLLIAGGEDHRTGQASHDEYEKKFKDLEQWLKARFPGIGTFDYRWSGQVLETMDFLPYIGQLPYRTRKIYMATGFSGNGMTYGTAAGMILNDLICGKKTLGALFYNPTRKKISSLLNFIKINARTMKSAFKWFCRSAGTTGQELGPGEGAILSKGARRIAAYRDEKGELKLYSAVCTHLGCLVQWNNAEKSFDCPCHGSRYSCKGEVIQGPANKDLKHLKE